MMFGFGGVEIFSFVMLLFISHSLSSARKQMAELEEEIYQMRVDLEMDIRDLKDEIKELER